MFLFMNLSIETQSYTIFPIHDKFSPYFYIMYGLLSSAPYKYGHLSFLINGISCIYTQHYQDRVPAWTCILTITRGKEGSEDNRLQENNPPLSLV